MTQFTSLFIISLTDDNFFVFKFIYTQPKIIHIIATMSFCQTYLKKYITDDAISEHDKSLTMTLKL